MARSKPSKQPDGCPKCGSKKVASILYGLPMFDEELERQTQGRWEVHPGRLLYHRR